MWLLLPLIAVAVVGVFGWYAFKPVPKPPVLAKPVAVEVASAEPAEKKPDQAAISPELQEFYDSRQLLERNETARCYDHNFKYSTQCINSAHQTVRVFQFPKQISLGKIETKNQRLLAQGDVIITDPGPFSFSTSYACCERPSLLDNFRPDEINDLSVSHLDSATDEVLSHVDKWSNLQCLNIGTTEITNRGLSHLTDSTSLIDLRAPDTAVTGKAIASLKCINNLERLEVSMLPEASDLIRVLRGSKCLKTLNIQGSKLTDEDLENLSTIATLKDIDISANKQITDKGLRYLNLPKLRGLGIKQCSITEASFTFLKSLPSLSNVSIGEDWSPQKEMLFHQMMPRVALRHDTGMRQVFKMINN
jgi:hypothetical protein